MRDRERKKKQEREKIKKKYMKGIMGNGGKRNMAGEILGKEWGKRERVVNERIT